MSKKFSNRTKNVPNGTKSGREQKIIQMEQEIIQMVQKQCKGTKNVHKSQNKVLSSVTHFSIKWPCVAMCVMT